MENVVLNEEFGRARAPMRADLFGDTLVGPTVLQASFFFSRSETIWGGTAEFLRNIVGERVLGSPR